MADPSTCPRQMTTHPRDNWKKPIVTGPVLGFVLACLGSLLQLLPLRPLLSRPRPFVRRNGGAPLHHHHGQGQQAGGVHTNLLARSESSVGLGLGLLTLAWDGLFSRPTLYCNIQPAVDEVVGDGCLEKVVHALPAGIKLAIEMGMAHHQHG
jgi:hypothetical protein